MLYDPMLIRALRAIFLQAKEIALTILGRTALLSGAV